MGVNVDVRERTITGDRGNGIEIWTEQYSVESGLPIVHRSIQTSDCPFNNDEWEYNNEKLEWVPKNKEEITTIIPLDGPENMLDSSPEPSLFTQSGLIDLYKDVNDLLEEERNSLWVALMNNDIETLYGTSFIVTSPNCDIEINT